MTAIQNRYDFVYLFDVTDGNPNGDPDAGNLPRLDPETSQGLVTDVCLKRKVRNFVQMAGKAGCEIFVQERRPLNPLIAEACDENEMASFKKEKGGWDKDKAKKRSQADIGVLQSWLCGKYFDVRAFGAVLSTGPNAGQVRGPVQLTFARSVEPILPIEISITRVADVDEEEGEMGRKHVVPYGLYRAHGYISAPFAERTGFSEGDLELLWTALEQMFDHDRAAARGEMVARRLVVFRHRSSLGNAPAHKLFERVTVKRVHGGESYDLPDAREHSLPPARSWPDYLVYVDRNGIPGGVEIVERI
ncbi:MAG: type I-C CRISPR-associated protein Cas7/Csd2 [Acidobacteriota bacterium]|nr:type I-C CRISPR-associated protein Cas7/Csd2 [Acidobacteriota bacterium]